MSEPEPKNTDTQASRLRRVGLILTHPQPDGFNWAREIGISEDQIYYMKFDGHNARLLTRRRLSAPSGQQASPVSEKPKTTSS